LCRGIRRASRTGEVIPGNSKRHGDKRNDRRRDKRTPRGSLSWLGWGFFWIGGHGRPVVLVQKIRVRGVEIVLQIVPETLGLRGDFASKRFIFTGLPSGNDLLF
jgi:hypothetical protein